MELLEALPKNAVCAELGVFRGDFSAEILNRTHPKTLYLVDLFEGVMRSGDRNGENVIAIDMREEMRNVRKRFKANPEVVVIRSCSWKWLALCKAASLDWIYIDTSHNYEDTQKELLHSWDVVKPRGFICGHDYSHHFPGVMCAVNEFVQRYGMDLELFSGDSLPSFRFIRQQPIGVD